MSARYLIWSNQHQTWWGPDWSGYTPLIEAAGRYELDEAQRIIAQATVHGQLKHETPNPFAWQGLEPTLTTYDEVMVLAPEWTPQSEAVDDDAPTTKGDTHV